MTAVREQIFAKIEELLGAIAQAEEVERMPSGDPDRFPALHIYDEGDRLTEGEAGTQRWAMSVGIDGYVETSGGAAAHGAANALYSAAIETLFAEPVLGGLAEEIEADAVKFTVAERAAKRRLAFSLDLTIHYATRRGSPQIIQ